MFLDQNHPRLHSRRILLVFVFLLSTFTWLLLKLPPAPTPPLAEQAMGFQVIAHSSSPQDQAIKQKVSDIIAPHLVEWTADATLDEALQILENQKDEIRGIAISTLSYYGYNEGVSVEIGQFPYHNRIVAGENLPSATYSALRIVIGEGKGENCFSLLFPSLSLYVASNAPPESLYRVTSSFAKENITYRLRFFDILEGN